MNSTGSCVCGKIQYQFDGDFTECSYCHCSICRKLTGSAFATYGGVAQSDFRWVKGSKLLSRFSQTEETDRWFCSQCGAYLITVHKPESNIVYVSLGSLDEAPKIQMAYHQFFGSKIGWCVITDDLQRFDEWPDDT